MEESKEDNNQINNNKQSKHNVKRSVMYNFAQGNDITSKIKTEYIANT